LQIKILASKSSADHRRTLLLTGMFMRCCRIWQTVIENVCNVLPTDWSSTHARELLQSSLNVSAVKVSGLI